MRQGPSLCSGRRIGGREACVGSLTGESQHAAVYLGSIAAWRTIGGILLGVGLYRALGPMGRE